MLTIEKLLKNISYELYDFWITRNINECRIGRYDFSDGCFINIDEYNTNSRENCEFEIHEKYIDIQYLVSGEEIIEFYDIKDYEKLQKFNSELDTALLGNTTKGNIRHLLSHDFCLIYPGTAHMPCLNAIEGLSKACRKIVIKIPLKKMKKLFIMDVDGTLTKGDINICSSGELFKSFNIKDGYGIKNILPNYNFLPIVITGRKSNIVLERCKELNIQKCYQACEDKEKTLLNISEKFGIIPDIQGILRGVAYIGDDLPDLKPLRIVEYSACPSDSVQQICDSVEYICKRKGGDGAVREFIDFLCS